MSADSNGGEGRSTPKERFAVLMLEDDGFEGGFSHVFTVTDSNPERAVDEAFESLSVASARRIVSVLISDIRTWQAMEVPRVE